MYDWVDNGETLFSKAQKEMYNLFIDNYKNIRKRDFAKVPQSAKNATIHFSDQLEPASLIDLDKKYQARALLNLIRARTFSDYPACYFYSDGNKYEIRTTIRKVPHE